jgi:NOL1/NOP2/fmu family ribosome biogenesis protein
MCARRQAEILHSGAALLKPGGRLVYSTCTFAPEENELCMEAFLQSHPEFEREDVSAPWFTPVGVGAFRLWPHKLLGEGHFVAVLHKKEGEESDTSTQKADPLPKVFTEFAKDLEIKLPAGKALQFGQSLFWIPEEFPDIRGIKVMRPGLELGEVKKDRFEPAHALALWLKTAARTENLSPESAEIQAFLRGETITSNHRSWTLVTVGGYSIGWGKGDGKVLKNHYPKGLRR